MTRSALRTVLAGCLVALGAVPASAEAGKTSCTVCHGDSEMFDEELLGIVTACEQDVHAAVGVSCHDCHGGNPALAVADDMDAAMDSGFGKNPYRGAPEPSEIPAFCGRCHSDPDYMKRFRPAARVDQETEYWTSFHGRALRKGDERVATCVSCHGAHGVRRSDDVRSPVYPLQVAKTCGGCHESPDIMRGTTVHGGRPVPLDQVARWRESVHGVAMMERGDLYAPTCNDCHGNHGASPPGLESVTFVCGQCHGREAKLLRESPKHAGFVAHNEFFADDESMESCASCHEHPDPAAALTDLDELGQCTACHGNHSIARPTSALFGNLPETPCALCHGTGVDTGESIPEPADRVANFRRQQDALSAEADRLGLEGDARYDWFVDRALELPFHTEPATERVADRAVLRPEFGRLFQKFRVGKTHISFRDPVSGESRTERVRNCSDCHAQQPELAEEAVGLRVAGRLLERMQELERIVARAERMLLTARRGGVEVGHAQVALDGAIDSQIQLQVLVHAFSVEEGGPFLEAHAEGIAHATEALEASVAALGELRVRRSGLTWSLAFIGLVLIGLALKIREQSRRTTETEG